MGHDDQWIETSTPLLDPARDLEGFPRWCEREFPWSEGDTEEVPVACREAYEDHDFVGREPRYARHPDLGWMVVAERAEGEGRVLVWHEATVREVVAAAHAWAD